MKSFEELSADASELCREIEKLPAGDQQTKVSIMAAHLASDIQERERAAQAGEPFTQVVPVYYRCKTCGRLFENDMDCDDGEVIHGHPMKVLVERPADTSLANNADPNEDQVLAAVQTILDGRQQTVTALGNEKTTLNTSIQTLTAERDSQKSRADQNATALGNEQTARKADRKAGAAAVVDAAIRLGIVTVADRDAKIAALENSTDFSKDSETLLKTEPTHKTNRSGLDMSGRQQAALSNEAAVLQNEYDAAFKTELSVDQDPVKAHHRIMHGPKYAGLAAKLVPRQGGAA